MKYNSIRVGPVNLLYNLHFLFPAWCKSDQRLTLDLKKKWGEEK